MRFHPKTRVMIRASDTSSQRELPEEGAPLRHRRSTGQRLEEIAAHYPPEHGGRRSSPRCTWCRGRHRVNATAQGDADAGEVIGVTPADVDDVVTYYVMFFREPVGRYVVQVCRTLSCALRGAERLTEELSKKLGVKVGGTDPTGTFTLMEMECLGACDRAPVVMVNDAHWQECRPRRKPGG